MRQQKNGSDRVRNLEFILYSMMDINWQVVYKNKIAYSEMYFKNASHLYQYEGKTLGLGAAGQEKEDSLDTMKMTEI